MGSLTLLAKSFEGYSKIYKSNKNGRKKISRILLMYAEESKISEIMFRVPKDSNRLKYNKGVKNLC